MSIAEKLTTIAENEQKALAAFGEINAALSTKGVETADTLEQVPRRIGEIPDGVVLLHRTEITEPVRAFSIDFKQEWKEYFAILIVPRDLKPNAREWLCFKDSVVSNESYIGTPSGVGAPLFTPQHTAILLSFYGGKCYSHRAGWREEIDVNKLTTLNFYTYYDPNTFDSGAVELYGVRHFIR